MLSAPHWDASFDEWVRVVFPTLEASVLAAGLGRELGIVCFHPHYETPDERWLARHRFGHMHVRERGRSNVGATRTFRRADHRLQPRSHVWRAPVSAQAPAKLRGYVRAHDAELAEACSDDDLLWAGSYQRRSPHAMINVLWARQLEQAEQKRRSSLLYTRNVQRALSEGRQELDQVAAVERSS